MPIYEYNCQKCNAHVEILQKITDKPLSKCPKCAGKLEKQWSQTSFQLKGSGWYVTDYARKDAKDKKETKDKGDSAATTKSETPATTEPAATASTAESKSEPKKTKKEKPAATSSSKE